MLAAVLGTWDESAGSIVVNERTTVATVWCMAQFLDGLHIGRNAPGLQNAAPTVRNLLHLSTGEVAAVLGNPPNGMRTNTLATFNSVANLLSLCAQEPNSAMCAQLLSLATPPGPSPWYDLRSGSGHCA